MISSGACIEGRHQACSGFTKGNDHILNAEHCECICHRAGRVHTTTERELTDWWLRTAEHEIDATVPKSVEYGAYDLELMGAVLADTIGWDESVTPRTPALMTELGIFVYLLGKVGRLASAYHDSRSPSDDTWFDAGVYARMAQRARSHNGWPGSEGSADGVGKNDNDVDI